MAPSGDNKVGKVGRYSDMHFLGRGEDPLYLNPTL